MADEASGNRVIAMVQEWDVGNQVKAMCFDTTASNTGKRRGASGVIENELGKTCCIWHADTTCTKLLLEMCSNTALVRHLVLTLACSSVFMTTGHELT